MTALDLAYTDIGHGRPILVAHGLFGSKRNWQGIAKALSRHGRVMSLDLRNHGESPWDDDSSYETMADDIARFIRRHGLGPAAVVGHSMGGKAAMTLALRHPELVRRLAVVDIAPVAYGHDYADIIAAMQEAPLAETDKRAEVQAFLSERIVDPGVVAFLVLNLERAEAGFRWQPNLTAIAAGIDGILDFPKFPHGRSYKGPTLFLAGGASDYIQSHHQAAIAALFPKAVTDLIDGAGHWVHAEQPQAFVARLLEFLGNPGN